MKPHVFLNKSARNLLLLITLLLVSANSVAVSQAQTSVFTYQGKLTDNGNPANGSYDLQFKLYSALSDGTLIGTRTRPGVLVTGGVFTVQLDFAPGAFGGPDRFLEIGVRPAGSLNPFTTLDPRQPITSTPYAFHSLASDVADAAVNANQLGGVNASQYVLTTDSRMTDARPPIAGSTNYIENSTSPQAATNFNISGNGTAGGSLSATTVSAVTQYNIGGTRILSAPGTSNLFAGASAGLLNSGTNNSFFGRNAGFINTSGGFNSFFGSNSGVTNTTGGNNSFFGYRAGQFNTAGADNAFFGVVAGSANSTGLRNSFFGGGAGFSNDTANNNSFFGNAAGYNNEDGEDNVFVGYRAGLNNRFGTGNTSIGAGAGANILLGNGNTFLGQNANSSVDNLTNATAIGANAQVGTSNTLVLGTNAVTVKVPGNLSITGTLTGNLPGGDGSYIQNRNSQQSGNANFNINGSGTLGGNLTATSVSAVSVSASNSIFVDGPIDTTSQYRLDGIVALSRSSFGDTIISSDTEFVSTANTFKAGRVVASSLSITGNADFNFSFLHIHPPLAPVNSNLPQLCLNSNNYISYCDSSLRPEPDVRNVVKEQQEQIKQQQAQLADLQEQLKQQQGQVETLKQLVCALNPTAEPCRK